jgi:thioredoxin reductase (NADPH)
LLEIGILEIFAVGDTRAGSVKRVAFTVGKASMAAHLVNRHFAEFSDQYASV